MMKPILYCFCFLCLCLGLQAQDASRGTLQSGSSVKSVGSSSVTGWVGNNVQYIETNSPTRVTAVKENRIATKLENLEASMFPNPVVNTSTLTINGLSQSFTIRMFDVQGKNSTPSALAGREFKQNNLEIPFQNLPTGYYQLEVLSKDRKMCKTIKVLKSN